MARHIVTVCVVCLLCAAHARCFTHASTFPTVNDTTSSVKFFTEPPGYSEHLLPDRINSTVTHSKSVNAKDSKGINNQKHSSNKVPQEKIKKLPHDDKLKEDSEINYEEQESRQKELMERLGQSHLETFKDSEMITKNDKNSRLKRSSELDEKYFTKKIFALYGDGENMTMEGFEKLLKKMGWFQSAAKVSEEEVLSIDSNQSGSHSGNFIIHSYFL